MLNLNQSKRFLSYIKHRSPNKLNNWDPAAIYPLTWYMTYTQMNLLKIPKWHQYENGLQNEAKSLASICKNVCLSRFKLFYICLFQGTV